MQLRNTSNSTAKKIWPRMQSQSLVDRFSSYLQGRARDWIQQPFQLISLVNFPL